MEMIEQFYLDIKYTAKVDLYFKNGNIRRRIGCN